LEQQTVIPAEFTYDSDATTSSAPEVTQVEHDRAIRRSIIKQRGVVWLRTPAEDVVMTDRRGAERKVKRFVVYSRSRQYSRWNAETQKYERVRREKKEAS
jgi:hypothetical protein